MPDATPIAIPFQAQEAMAYDFKRKFHGVGRTSCKRKWQQQRMILGEWFLRRRTGCTVENRRQCLDTGPPLQSVLWKVGV